jgi:septal ring factor EnvC (AmiA/AmiB activator)
VEIAALLASLVSLIGAVLTLYKARAEREQIEATASETITSTALSLIEPLKVRLREVERELRSSKLRIEELERDLALANRRIAELEAENRHYECLLEENNIEIDAA